MQFFLGENAWTGIANVVALLSLGVAVWALRWSARAARMNIPAPATTVYGNGTVEIAMEKGDMTHFAIGEIRNEGKMLQDCVTHRISETSAVSYLGDGFPVSELKFSPPTLLTRVASVSRGDVLLIKIVSRADTTVFSWIKARI